MCTLRFCVDLCTGGWDFIRSIMSETVLSAHFQVFLYNYLLWSKI